MNGARPPGGRARGRTHDTHLQNGVYCVRPLAVVVDVDVLPLLPQRLLHRAHHLVFLGLLRGLQFGHLLAAPLHGLGDDGLGAVRVDQATERQSEDPPVGADG